MATTFMPAAKGSAQTPLGPKMTSEKMEDKPINQIQPNWL